MNRLAPWLLILLAMGLCAWSLAAAQESPGDQSQASPTPLEMPTPVPVPVTKTPFSPRVMIPPPRPR